MALTAVAGNNTTEFLIDAREALTAIDLRTLPKDARPLIKDARALVKEAIKSVPR